jgi:hypothetical protein
MQDKLRGPRAQGLMFDMGEARQSCITEFFTLKGLKKKVKSCGDFVKNASPLNLLSKQGSAYLSLGTET